VRGNVERVGLIEVLPDNEDDSRLVLRVRGPRGVFRLSFTIDDLNEMSRCVSRESVV
jgi:hypothetical protein